MTTDDTRTHSHLGINKSTDSAPEFLDGLLAHSIRHTDIDDARALFSTKWWDYKFVHVGHSFFHFAHLYAEAVQKWRTMFGVSHFANLKADGNPLIVTRWEKNPDPSKHRKVKTMDLHSPAYRTGMWRAMCYADAHGVAYGRFIDIAFQAAFDMQWQRYPQPAMLGSIRLLEIILKTWEDEKRELMNTPVDPAYRIENYVGNHWQDEFQAWLLGFIAQRSHPDIALAHYLDKEPLILEEKAAVVLGVDVVRRAIARI